MSCKVSLEKLEDTLKQLTEQQTNMANDIKLKDLWFVYDKSIAAWYAYTNYKNNYNPHSDSNRRRLGIVSGRDDIKLVEKYVKKYQ